MFRWQRIAWTALVLVVVAGGSDAEVTIDFRSGYDPDPESKQALALAVRERLRESQGFLRRETDYHLDTRDDVFHVMIGHVRDQDGSIIPACYTFPDSMLRIAPEYLVPTDRPAAELILREFVRLEASPGKIQRECTPKEDEEVPSIVRDFVVSELVHELYHDWQNRQRRMPAVERGKTILNLYRGAVGPDWKAFLETHGVDMKQHHQQFARAELECCRIQTRYWVSKYGPEPAHPLARAFLSLMRAAAVHYQDRMAS